MVLMQLWLNSDPADSRLQCTAATLLNQPIRLRLHMHMCHAHIIIRILLYRHAQMTVNWPPNEIAKQTVCSQTFTVARLKIQRIFDTLVTRLSAESGSNICIRLKLYLGHLVKIWFKLIQIIRKVNLAGCNSVKKQPKNVVSDK